MHEYPKSPFKKTLPGTCWYKECYKEINNFLRLNRHHAVVGFGAPTSLLLSKIEEQDNCHRILSDFPFPYRIDQNVFSLPIFCFVNFRLLKKSSQIKAIEIHYFVPCCNKILNKFFLGIIASVHLGKGPKL